MSSFSYLILIIPLSFKCNIYKSRDKRDDLRDYLINIR
jgi:hypothetical protein